MSTRIFDSSFLTKRKRDLAQASTASYLCSTNPQTGNYTQEALLQTMLGKMTLVTNTLQGTYQVNSGCGCVTATAAPQIPPPSSHYLWGARISGLSTTTQPLLSGLDSNNNIIVVGTYNSTSTSDDATNMYDSLNAQVRILPDIGDALSIYIGKYPPSGLQADGIWGARLSMSISLSDCTPTSLTIDGLDNIIVHGIFRGDSLAIYNSLDTISTSLSPQGIQYNSFLTKYDPSGVGVWAARLVPTIGTGNINSSYTLIDSNNNIIITGQYVSDTIDIYDSTNTYVSTLGNDTRLNIYIVRYPPSGLQADGVWGARLSLSNTFGGLGVYSAQLDSDNNIILCGFYANSIANDSVSVYDSANNLITTLPLVGTQNAFIVKFPPSGLLADGAWGARLSGPNISSTISITTYLMKIDSNNNIIVSGAFQNDTITVYDSTNAAATTISTSGNSDSFVVKYPPSGSGGIWGAHVGGTNYDYPNTINIDTSNNIIICGQYQINNIVVYDSLGNSIVTLPSSGYTDSFIVKYPPSGSGGVWGARLSGTNDNTVISASIDTSNNIIVLGVYTGSLTIYDKANNSIQTLPSAAINDIYIVTYPPSGTGSIWAAHVSGGSYNYASKLSLDSANNIVLSGYYSSNPLTVYDKAGTSVTTLPYASGIQDVFVIKYPPSGLQADGVWGAYLSGNQANDTVTLSIDGNNDIVVYGYYNSYPLDMYGSDGNLVTTLPSDNNNPDNYNVFIAHYTPSGV